MDEHLAKEIYNGWHYEPPVETNSDAKGDMKEEYRHHCSHSDKIGQVRGAWLSWPHQERSDEEGQKWASHLSKNGRRSNETNHEESYSNDVDRWKPAWQKPLLPRRVLREGWRGGITLIGNGDEYKQCISAHVASGTEYQSLDSNQSLRRSSISEDLGTSRIVFCFWVLLLANMTSIIAVPCSAFNHSPSWTKCKSQRARCLHLVAPSRSGLQTIITCNSNHYLFYGMLYVFVIYTRNRW